MGVHAVRGIDTLVPDWGEQAPAVPPRLGGRRRRLPRRPPSMAAARKRRQSPAQATELLSRRAVRCAARRSIRRRRAGGFSPLPLSVPPLRRVLVPVNACTYSVRLQSTPWLAPRHPAQQTQGPFPTATIVASLPRSSLRPPEARPGGWGRCRPTSAHRELGAGQAGRSLVREDTLPRFEATQADRAAWSRHLLGAGFDHADQGACAGRRTISNGSRSRSASISRRSSAVHPPGTPPGEVTVRSSRHLCRARSRPRLPTARPVSGAT